MIAPTVHINLHITMGTLHNKFRMPFRAHFITEYLPIPTFNFWQPSPMRIFMILAKCISHLINTAVELKLGKLMWYITVDNFSCSDDESFFVPLVIRTVVLVHAVDVAEFGAAFVAIRSR